MGEMKGLDGCDSYQRVAVDVDPYEYAWCFGWIYAIFSRNKTVREKKLRLSSVPVSCP
jgi:hypothetical protein